MGQLSLACYAPDEYTALVVREELERCGIPCLVFSNEIPMRAGFNFELRPYAEVYVREEDAVEAAEIARDVQTLIAGEEPEPGRGFPPTINLRAAPVVTYILGVGFAIAGGLAVSGLIALSGIMLTASLDIAFLTFSAALAATVWLNWPRFYRAIAAAACTLPLVPVYIVRGIAGLILALAEGILRGFYWLTGLVRQGYRRP